MDFSEKKFSIEKALFRLDNEFQQSTMFKIYKFATLDDYKKGLDILNSQKFKFIADKKNLTIEFADSEDDQKVAKLFGIESDFSRDKKSKNYIVFKALSFRKDKHYIFKKKNYTCQVCGFKAPLIKIGPLKILGWEAECIIPLGLDVHLVKSNGKTLAFCLCDKCHFSYHYFSKLDESALLNWKQSKRG